jgi:hypothetical protein
MDTTILVDWTLGGDYNSQKAVSFYMRLYTAATCDGD